MLHIRIIVSSKIFGDSIVFAFHFTFILHNLLLKSPSALSYHPSLTLKTKPNLRRCFKEILLSVMKVYFTSFFCQHPEVELICLFQYIKGLKRFVELDTACKVWKLLIFIYLCGNIRSRGFICV